MAASWTITTGQKVVCGDSMYEITQILDLQFVLGKHCKTGTYEKLAVADLKLFVPVVSFSSDPQSKSETDLGSVAEKDWNEALRRAESMKRLIQLPKIVVAKIDEEAEILGVSRATVYRYLDKYTALGNSSSMIPSASDGGRGRNRTEEQSETILRSAINEFYLTKQSPKVQQVITEYKRLCNNAKIPPAHDNTVRNRIKKIVELEKISKRQGQAAARHLRPAPGKYPEGNYPLEVVQIDHTPIDLQFVDDVSRLSVGRFYLTVAIDVYSRMILGFYISPDAPSITSVGMCLAHAILPKEAELARLGIEKPWSCWGIMSKIYADNAGEFRGDNLKRACQEYGIDLEWRPVGKPHYGAHIERLIKTFMEEVHTLPGTTFSNVSDKGEYDSEKEAVFTLADFEKWLTVYITGVYHKREHSGIGMPPDVKFERGIFVGDDEFGPVGMPPRVTDELKLRIDFMPTVERTIQKFGVEIDFTHYYDAVLIPFIGAKNPHDDRYARKFIFKRNPRSLQKIHFYHPDLKQYFEVPYGNLMNPDVSLREYNAAKKKLKDDGIKIESEEQIFASLNQMRQIRDNAVKITKKARSEAQRNRIYQEQNSRHGLTSPGKNTSMPKNDGVSQPEKTVHPQSWGAIYDTPDDELPPLEVDDY